MAEEIWLFEHNERFNNAKAIVGYPNRKGDDIKAMKHFMRLMETTRVTGAVFLAQMMPAGSVKPGDVIDVEPTVDDNGKVIDITDLEYNRLAKRYTTADTWLYPHHTKEQP